MALAVMAWALAHLLANGMLHDVVLFGSFLLWSALGFRAARRREPPKQGAATLAGTLVAMTMGTAGWAGFAYYLHAPWMGVAPFPA